MATVRGILAQSAPLANTLTDIYTAPAAKSVTGRVIVTNRGTTDAAFRVSIGVVGAADSPEQYISYDKGIQGNDTGSTIAFFLNTADVLRVRSSNANLSFSFTGAEVDN